MLTDVSRELLSSFFGYASIAAWLGAQLPQLRENHRKKSAASLSLPFLVSWFFGDLTNLVGCVLTDQLPFQTYLATYFVTVDVGLLTQFFYYARRYPKHQPATAPESPRRLRRSYPSTHWRRDSSNTLPRSDQSARAAKRRSNLRGQSTETVRRGTKRHGLGLSGSHAGHPDEDPMAASWMSGSSLSSNASGGGGGGSTPRTPKLAFSGTLSETERRGRPRTRPSSELLSSSAELPRHRHHHVVGEMEQIESPTVGAPPSGGLSSSRLLFDPDGAGRTPRSGGSGSRSRPPPPARRSTSIAYLSVWALVTFGGWDSHFSGRSGSSSSEVNVQGGDQAAERAWMVGGPVVQPLKDGIRWSASYPAVLTLPVAVPSAAGARGRRHVRRAAQEENELPVELLLQKQKEKKGKDWKRIIGRVSAWVCTTLYLTSRLPQLWKNFRRQSVEGLSMLLFTMAFTGNLLYVISILINPLATTRAYLMETLPYLLGSGGTLCFDMTIVMQSFWYSTARIEARRKKEQARRRKYAARMGYSVGGAGEEEAGLLSGHSEDDSHPRQRSRSVSARSGRGRSVSGGGSRSVSGSSRRHRTPTSSTDVSGSSSVIAYPHTADGHNEHFHDPNIGFKWGNEHENTLGGRPLPANAAPVDQGGVRRSMSTSEVARHIEPIIEEGGESGVTLRGR